MSPLKIVFMGTPDFAVPALQALIQSGHEVVAVYTQPPRPKGRGHALHYSPVYELAESHNIPVYTPETLKKDADAQAEFTELNPDVAVVAAYGLILPQAVLGVPKYGCLNIHASLLPRWRGASPIQHAIWKGDKESGNSIMQMEEGLDTGPVIARQSVPIGANTTAQTLHDDLSVLGATMLVDVLDRLAREEGDLESQVQDDDQSTYAPLLRKNDGNIDWSQTAEEIDRQIRALNPWPGVGTATKDGRRIKIIEAKPVSGDFSDKPGTLINRTGLVVCGNNTALNLAVVQPENAKKMDVVSAVNGGYLNVGDCFEGTAGSSQ